MQLTELIGLLQNNSLGVFVFAVIVVSCIQISPIEINPWSWIAKRLASIFNAEVIKKFDDVNKKLDALERRMDSLENQVIEMQDDNEENRAITTRTRILRFADELLNNIPHSKETFDSTLLDIDFYEEYCREHPGFKNNKTVLSVAEIKKNYTERLEKHDFLYSQRPKG